MSIAKPVDDPPVSIGNAKGILRKELTAVSSFALGLAVQGLHAQMTPPAYVVAMNDVKDEAAYKNEFLPPVLKAIADHGGKYVAGGFKRGWGSLFVR